MGWLHENPAVATWNLKRTSAFTLREKRANKISALVAGRGNLSRAIRETTE
jgi:hypothetical protein